MIGHRLDICGDPATLEPCDPDAQPELLLGRGFIGHEHLPWFGLVNMNARLYDPAVSRFLSPEPLVQAPDDTQSYNRYSYCLNNPLRYVDESGMNYYYLNPDGVYQQLAPSGDMNVLLPNLNVYGGRSAWSGWSSSISAPFDYSAWRGGLPVARDWREDRYGSPVGHYAHGEAPGGDDGNSAATRASLGNASIAVNSLSGLPTLVETAWDNVVRRNLDMPLLKDVKPSDYAEAFKTAAPLTKELKPAADMAQAAKYVKGFGKVLTIADVGITFGSAMVDVGNQKYASAVARSAVMLTTIAISAVPGVGPMLALSIGMADALWGQQFYDYVQETYDNW